MWDLRHTKYPFKEIDWNGGIRDHKGGWVTHYPEEYNLHIDKFEDDKPFLYSVRFTQDLSHIIAGGLNGLRIFDYKSG